MISTLKNPGNYVTAYMEWHVCNKLGIPIKDGEYCNVRDLWVHEAYDGKKAISEFITILDEHPSTHNVKWIYWYRTKYNDRPSRLFRREKAAKKGVKYELV